MSAAARNLRPLVNRGQNGWELPADGWIQLTPIGQFPHATGKVVQVVDEAAVKRMANRFRADAAQANFGGLLLDFDHFSYDPAKSSEAAGWIQDVEARADGLWGKVRWTPEGEAALKNGRYRFVSPVWMPNETLRLSHNAPNGWPQVRPLRLDSAGLTNQPNLRGMAPLSNREGNLAQQPKTQMKEKLIELLGLPADATDEDILAAVEAVKGTAAEAEPMANRLRKMEAEMVESDLVRFANRFSPDKKEVVRAQLLANRAGTLALLEATTPATGSAPLHNRATAKPPTSPVLGAAEQSDRQNAEVRAYMNRHGVKFEAAWDAVRAQKPELFRATT